MGRIIIREWKNYVESCHKMLVEPYKRIFDINGWFIYKGVFLNRYKPLYRTTSRIIKKRSFKRRDCGRLYSLDSASIKRWSDIRIKKRRLKFDFKKM